MNRSMLGFVGMCALTFASLAPAAAMACPDEGKKPSIDACPGDDTKKPSVASCPGDDTKKPSALAACPGDDAKKPSVG